MKKSGISSGGRNMTLIIQAPNKSEEPINYPAGNLLAHFKRCSSPRSGDEQRPR
jgi:hypothetical protein